MADTWQTYICKTTRNKDALKTEEHASSMDDLRNKPETLYFTSDIEEKLISDLYALEWLYLTII